MNSNLPNWAVWMGILLFCVLFWGTVIGSISHLVEMAKMLGGIASLW